MDWFDEIRIMRMRDEDAGLLCKIRLTFKGKFSGFKTDADDVFGCGWMVRAERLRRAGVLRVEDGGRSVTMTVVSPGDKKREQVRKANRKYRAKHLHASTEICVDRNR